LGKIDSEQKFHNAVKMYKLKLAVGEESLANSHDDCALLRTRSKETVDFLVDLYPMEERGQFYTSDVD
jgi:hypothetical protein